MGLRAAIKEYNDAVRAARVIKPGDDYARAVARVHQARNAYRIELRRVGRRVPFAL